MVTPKSPFRRQTLHLSNEQFAARFRRLLEKGKYWEATRLSIFMDEGEFLTQACPVVTTFEHFDGLFQCLGPRGALGHILKHVGMEFLRRVILESEHAKFEYTISTCIHDLVIPTLEEQRYDRAIDILKAVQERYAEGDGRPERMGEVPKFRLFMDEFIKRLLQNGDGTSVKKFFNLHGKNIWSRCQDIFGVFYQSTAQHLRDRNDR